MKPRIYKSGDVWWVKWYYGDAYCGSWNQALDYIKNMGWVAVWK